MWSRTHTAPGLALSSPSPLPPRTLDEWGTDQTTAWDCKCLIVFFSFFLIHNYSTTTLWPNCQHTITESLFHANRHRRSLFLWTGDFHPTFGSQRWLCIWQPLKATSDMQVCPSLVWYFVLAFIRTSADVAWLTEVRYWKVRKSNVIACMRQIIFLQKKYDMPQWSK